MSNGEVLVSDQVSGQEEEVNACVMVYIREHLQLPNGNIVVNCIGGPRVAVVQEESVVIEDDKNPAPLIRARVRLLSDTEHTPAEVEELSALRARALKLLASLTEPG